MGLPNQRQFYREWQLLNQQNMSSQSVQAQLYRWVIFLDQWEAVMGHEVLVLGDMNINHLDWSLPIGQQSSQTVKLRPLIEKLFSKIFPYSVCQCVSVPTRFMQGQHPTGLDHFYTNQPTKLSVVETQFWGGSDHKLICATRHSKAFKRCARYVQKRCYKHFVLWEFLAELSKISWWDLYKCEEVDVAVDFFSNKFLSVVDQFAPIRSIQTRTKYAPWLTHETKLLINERNDAQRIAALNLSFYI